jgi:hypothetical protein
MDPGAMVTCAQRGVDDAMVKMVEIEANCSAYDRSERFHAIRKNGGRACKHRVSTAGRRG